MIDFSDSNIPVLVFYVVTESHKTTQIISKGSVDNSSLFPFWVDSYTKLTSADTLLCPTLSNN